MPVIAAANLKRLTLAVIEATGSAPEESEIVADHLVMANLTGHDSHGVGMIPRYIDNFRNGLVKPNRPARKINDLGAILQFDGDKGYGQRVAKEAMQAAIDRARELGVCLYTLSNAHHVGRIGAYGQQAIDTGFSSIHFVNVADHGPSVAPYSGGEARLVTNPVCIAVPGAGGADSLLLDMATSSVALGKVRVAYNKGLTVEKGLLLDPDGVPTTDPGVMFPELTGAITPFGKYKGYGLALMSEILGGVMSGGKTIQPGTERLNGIINSMFGVVFDPAKLVDPDHFAYEFKATIDYVKSAKPQDPEAPVMVAGDPERKATKARLADGIDIDATTWTEILDAGVSLGLDRDALAAQAAASG
ncbi:MAG: malate/lactate/ureidoglycolate dehydrogenase [Alphaproteobacteria bacterium]|nr:malate/lactate/ureidoglycolate dehydrogenase [Alphaproteobacteria bacterium]